MCEFQGEERGGSKAIISTMNRKVKQAKNMGNNDKHFWGSREHELKTFLGIRGFINGKRGIKSKKIKGSREHVPPLGGALFYLKMWRVKYFIFASEWHRSKDLQGLEF